MKGVMILLLGCMGINAGAQEIAGTVLDGKREPAYDAEVLVKQGDVLKYALCTDYDGNYIAKPLEAGKYDLIFWYAGHDTMIMKNVVVHTERTTVNAMLEAVHGTTKTLVKQYKKPLINQDSYKPTISLSDITQLYYGCGGCHHIPLDLGVRRNTGTLYIIDGVEVGSLKTIEMQDLPKPEVYVPHTLPYALGKDEVRRIPTVDLKDMVALSPGVYQRQRSGNVNIGGGGEYGTLYVVDGMVINPHP